MAQDEELKDRNDDQLPRIWRHVNTLITKVDVMKEKVDRLDEDIYNHGRDGLKSQFAAFVTEFRTKEAERERFQNQRDQEIKDEQALRHRENTERLEKVSSQIGKKTLLWTAAGVSVALAGVLVAALSIYVMFRLSKVGNLEKIFIGVDAPLVYALDHNHPQEAGGTTSIHY